jgi:hypothetical protein
MASASLTVSLSVPELFGQDFVCRAERAGPYTFV